MTTTIDKYTDIVDSRDVIARIEELENERQAAVDAVLEMTVEQSTDCAWALKDGTRIADSWGEDDEIEYQELKELAEEASGSPDWTYGEALIRDSYFETYAQELAEDIGALEHCDKWPATCIDWERAARELQQDYMRVDWGGVEYWIRA